MKKMLEVVVDSVDSAIAAEKGGALRLELCANLILGGTSPDEDLFQMVRERVNIPIRPLLRPRFGDFLYSENEFELLKRQVTRFSGLGAEGVVIGVLRPDGMLDQERMKLLMDAAGAMRVTLHRAFDVCRDPYETLETAKELGIDTILTSGQNAKVMEGNSLLKALVSRSGSVQILIGGGVTPELIPVLHRETGATAFHLSGKKTVESGMQYRKEGVPMGLPGFSEFEIQRCDEAIIEKARAVLEGCLA